MLYAIFRWIYAWYSGFSVWLFNMAVQQGIISWSIFSLLQSYFSQVLNPKQLTGSKVCHARQKEELAVQHVVQLGIISWSTFSTPILTKFSIPNNLPAARFAAPDKRKSWLFNMAVQLGIISWSIFSAPILAKFSIPNNLPAARFAALDKRKSRLFNMAVQLGMAIGRFVLPPSLPFYFFIAVCVLKLITLSRIFSLKILFCIIFNIQYCVRIRLSFDGLYDRCRKSRKSDPKAKFFFPNSLTQARA